MIKSSLHLNWRLAGLWLAVAFAPLAGCLPPDNSPIVQVVPRLVIAPQNPHFRAIDFVPPVTGSLQAIWNRSTADTQQNFKGYFVKLYLVTGLDVSLSDSALTIVDTLTILRVNGAVDTTATFPNKSIGRYRLVVRSEKSSARDTVIYSTDSSVYSAYYDPRPLHDPIWIKATSIAPNIVGLCWPLSVDDTNQGFYQYIVYARDTTKSNDSGRVVGNAPKSSYPGKFGDTVSVPISPTVVIPGSTTSEYPFKFWVKSERIDSTFFYSGNPDTNAITWAGTQSLSPTANDTIPNVGYKRIVHSMYFGSYNGQWDVVDSGLGAQVGVVIDQINNTVTLYDSAGSNFIQALSGGTCDMVDTSLSDIFYSSPLNTPLGVSSITLPTPSDSKTNAIVYLQMPDNTNSKPLKGSHWARMLIHNQGGGTFINNATGGIDIKASYQVGVSKDGSTNLFYY